MDITTFGKPLRRLSLAFAIIVAILPVYGLGILAFRVLTGSELYVGPRSFFVVSVLGGLSFLFVAIYIFIRKTKHTGIIIAIFVYFILGTYLGYEIFTKIILRI